MDIRTVFGIPAHPLLVHIPVLGIPVAFLVLIAFVAMPERRPALFWSVGLLTIGVAIATILTAGSGEQLENMLPPDDRTSAPLQRHTELGDQTETIVIIFALVTVAMLALYWYTYLRKPTEHGTSRNGSGAGLKTGLMVLGIAAILFGGLATVWDVRTGHAGAKSAWGDVLSSPSDAGTGSSSDGD